jgi:hypothetical protein
VTELRKWFVDLPRGGSGLTSLAATIMADTEQPHRRKHPCSALSDVIFGQSDT